MTLLGKIALCHLTYNQLEMSWMQISSPGFAIAPHVEIHIENYPAFHLAARATSFGVARPVVGALERRRRIRRRVVVAINAVA